MDYITYVVSTASPEQTSSAESLNSVSNVERQDEWFLNHALQVRLDDTFKPNEVEMFNHVLFNQIDT